MAGASRLARVPLVSRAGLTISGGDIAGLLLIFAVRQARMLGPTAAREGAVATRIHADYDAEDDDDGAGETKHMIAILHDGPEGGEEQKAFPLVACGPTHEANKRVQREQEGMAVGECAGDLRRRGQEQRRLLVNEDGRGALGSGGGSGGREIRG